MSIPVKLKLAEPVSEAFRTQVLEEWGIGRVYYKSETENDDRIYFDTDLRRPLCRAEGVAWRVSPTHWEPARKRNKDR